MPQQEGEIDIHTKTTPRNPPSIAPKIGSAVGARYVVQFRVQTKGLWVFQFNVRALPWSNYGCALCGRYFQRGKSGLVEKGGKRGRGAAATSSCIQHLVFNVIAALPVLFVIAGRCFRMPCWVALNPTEYPCCFTWAQFCHAHRRARTTPRCSVVNFFFLALCYQPVSCCCCCNRSCRCRGVSL